MKMQDLKSKKIQFNLEATGKHTLRPFTLGDEIWCKHNFTQDELSSIFDGSSFNLEVIAKIAFRLLIERNLYEMERVTVYDDIGEKVEINYGGFQKFLDSIKGDEEKVLVIKSCVDAINSSMPDAEKRENSKDKKKV